VTSAFELDDRQRELIASAMARRLGREVELDVELDTALIAGIVIRSGDEVIDASLLGRLHQLESEFS